MANAFMNWTSRAAIDARIAEEQRHPVEIRSDPYTLHARDVGGVRDVIDDRVDRPGRAVQRREPAAVVVPVVRVVGIFEANGSAAESELWCDAKVLQPAYHRGNSYQAVYAKLASHDAFDAVKDALTTDPRLNVTPIREPEYYARQSQTLQRVIRTVGFAIAALMACSAARRAAKGVLLREPLKPTVPADCQEITLPAVSVMLTIVLLNVLLMWASP